jgi:hypothetical protein
VEAPGKDGNASMPEQIKRPKSMEEIMRMMMMMMMIFGFVKHNQVYTFLVFLLRFLTDGIFKTSIITRTLVFGSFGQASLTGHFFIVYQVCVCRNF